MSSDRSFDGQDYTRRTDEFLTVARELIGHPRVYYREEAGALSSRSTLRTPPAGLAYDKAIAFPRQRGKEGDTELYQRALDEYLSLSGCEENGIIVAIAIQSNPESSALQDDASTSTLSGILFSLEVGDVSTDCIESIAKRLCTLAPLVRNSHEHDYQEAMRVRDGDAQAFIIRLCRLAQGEIEFDSNGGAAPDSTHSGAQVRLQAIFSEAATFLNKWLGDASEGCVIIDASEVRFISSAAVAHHERTSDKKDEHGVRLTDRFTYVPSKKKVEAQDNDGEPARSGTTSSPNVKDASDSGSGNGSNTSRTSRSTHSNDAELLRGHVRNASLPDSDRQKLSDTSLTGSALRNVQEIYIPTPAQGVVCSFVNSDRSAPILGSAGLDTSRLSGLSGQSLRHIMASFFANARQSGTNSKCLSNDGTANSRSEVLHLRNILQLKPTGSVLCVASCDASLQPAFLIAVCLREHVTLRNSDTLTIETISSALTYTLLRARSDLMDQTQLLFIGKVQHELRTPLHAIIGINETVHYTLSASAKDMSQHRSDASTSPISPHGNINSLDAALKQMTTSSSAKTDLEAFAQQSADKTDAVVDEAYKAFQDLLDLSDLIASSADSLSSLVDDLVDFSILKRQESLSIVQPAFDHADHADSLVRESHDGLEHPPSQPAITAEETAAPSNDVRPLVSLETVFTVISSTAERAWTLYRPGGSDANSERRLPGPPPPELAFTVDPTYMARIGQKMMLRLDLEVIRRVTWKLVMNALQATDHGVVRVEARHRVASVDAKVPVFDSEDESEAAALASKQRIHRFEIKVIDTGRGMSEQFLSERIFQPYQKENPDSNGMGLSLALCRTMIEQLGGRIFAQSQKGQSTTLNVSLPLPACSREVCESWQQSYRDRNKVKLNSIKIAFTGFSTETLLAFKVVLVKQLVCQDVGDVLDTGSLADCDAVLFIQENTDIKNLLEIAETYTQAGNRLPPFVQLLSPRFPAQIEVSHLSMLRRLCHRKGRKMHVFKRPVAFSRLLALNAVLRRAEDAAGQSSESTHSDEKAISVEAPDNSAVDELSGATPAQGKVESSEEKPSSDRTWDIAAKDLAQDEDDPEELPREFKVMVVEDNELNARIITTLLKRAKLSCLRATNGQEAVDIFRKELPTIVLLDINMPIMNGFDAAREIRATPSPYKHYLAAVTALSSESDKVKGLQAGIDDWFTKPLRMGPLIEDIKRRKRDHDDLLSTSA